MDTLLVVMTFLIPIVAGLTELIKKYVNEKFYAVVPVIIGLVLSPLTASLPFIDASMPELLWAGLLTGLSAGGFYSVQNIRNKE